MKNIRTTKPLKRPRILVRAARIGLESYRRERDLKRLIQCTRCPTPGKALKQLYAIESKLENARRSGSAEYRAQRHIFAVTALLSELRLAAKHEQKLLAPCQPNASGSLALRSAT